MGVSQRSSQLKQQQAFRRKKLYLNLFENTKLSLSLAYFTFIISMDSVNLLLIQQHIEVENEWFNVNSVPILQFLGNKN